VTKSIGAFVFIHVSAARCFSAYPHPNPYAPENGQKYELVETGAARWRTTLITDLSSAD
jgi:hypothetical protein